MLKSIWDGINLRKSERENCAIWKESGMGEYKSHSLSINASNLKPALPMHKIVLKHLLFSVSLRTSPCALWKEYFCENQWELNIIFPMEFFALDLIVEEENFINMEVSHESTQHAFMIFSHHNAKSLLQKAIHIKKRRHEWCLPMKRREMWRRRKIHFKK